jgi:hypothetical protein
MDDIVSRTYYIRKLVLSCLIIGALLMLHAIGY